MVHGEKNVSQVTGIIHDPRTKLESEMMRCLLSSQSKRHGIFSVEAEDYLYHDTWQRNHKNVHIFIRYKGVCLCLVQRAVQWKENHDSQNDISSHLLLLCAGSILNQVHNFQVYFPNKYKDATIIRNGNTAIANTAPFLSRHTHKRATSPFSL